MMRLRNLTLVAVLTLIALVLISFEKNRREWRAPSAYPPVAHHYIEIPEGFEAPMDDLLPMHKAVHKAAKRFNGRVLEIIILNPTIDERTSGVLLVYRMRMVTPRRDVLDIRMNAVTGKFLEVRGADLGAARRKQKHEDEDD